MPSPVSSPPLFPAYSPRALLAFQFSSWYPSFSAWSIKSTVIRPLSHEFRQYLDSDGVFVPDGAEDMSVLLAYTALASNISTLFAPQPGRELPLRR